MSESLTAGSTARRSSVRTLSGLGQWSWAGRRRSFQLALAVIWLLDGVLQYQPFMFTNGFPQTLGATAAGNPAVIARPILWSTGIITHHVVLTNTAFATIQLLLGLGIAWRPTVKLALGASVIWALSVWWLGEGLGGTLAGAASPVNGAPGAVILYALLAVLLWPTDHDRLAPFVAGRAVGKAAAQVLWLLLWGSLAYFALLPASRAPQAASGMVSSMAGGEPGWLAAIDNQVARMLSGQGLVTSIVLAVALVIVALGVFLPSRAARWTIVLAVIVAAALWIAEALGGIFTGSGTDPNTGPLLALLALTYWPSTAPAPAGRAGRGGALPDTDALASAEGR
jgi:hypothetical protein